MFGRSGQMFPRRAYHDAIYEEEYGSEADDECCRGRGLSAILCWFLSVIILIGLAASVVLTVFFILRSRSFIAKNNSEDLSVVVFDHGNGFIVPTTSTTDLNFDFTSSSTSSKTPVGSGSDEVQTILSTSRATNTATTTTKPFTSRMTTRKYYSDTTGRSQYSQYDSAERTTPMPPTTNTNSMFKFLFDTIKTFQNDEFPESGEGGEKRKKKPLEENDEDIISNESVEQDRYSSSRRTTTPTTSSRRSSPTTTSRTMTSTSPILFTLPPSTSTISQSSNSRRNSGTTRYPERTSFSSEEITSTTYQQYDHSKHYIPNTSEVEKELQGDERTTEKTPTTIDEPEEEKDEINYQTEESSKKLTKMLIDQIPPHSNSDESDNSSSSSSEDKLTTTTTSLPPTTAGTEDLLAKIIKNLQPKWSKGRTTANTASSSSSTSTLETTTNKYNDYNSVTSRTRNRYVNKERENSKENGQGGSYVKVKRVKYRGSTTTAFPPSTIIIITPDNAATTEIPTTFHPSSSLSSSTTNKVSTSTRHYNSIPWRHRHTSSNKIEPSSTSSSTTMTTSGFGNTRAPIEIIKGPDFNGENKYGKKDKSNEIKNDRQKEHDEYLDILVGNDDHKTLVTKETEAGIITSAILPPWFDSSNSSTDTLELSNNTLKFTKTQTLASSDDSKNDHSKPKSDIDILLNLFSNSPLPAKKSAPNRTRGSLTSSSSFSSPSPSRKGHRNHHNYHHEMSAEESKKSIHLKNLEEQLKPFFSSPSEVNNENNNNGGSENVGNSPVNKVSAANNAFHYGSSDGTTNIYGYYPEDDLDEGESDDQLDIDIENGGKRKKNHKHDENTEDDDDPLNTSQSVNNEHVIDIAFDPKTRPEIVIEPEADEDDEGGGERADGVVQQDGNNEDEDEDAEYPENENYSDFLNNEETMAAASSDNHKHQVFLPPPENMRKENGIPLNLRRESITDSLNSNNNPNKNINNNFGITSTSGGGIRRPMSNEEEENDQSVAGNEPQPQRMDWSLKSDSNNEKEVENDKNGGKINSGNNQSSDGTLLPGNINNNPDDFSDEEPGLVDEIGDRLVVDENGNVHTRQESQSNDDVDDNNNDDDGKNLSKKQQEESNASNGESQDFVERKPILDVHESLYPSKEEPRLKVKPPNVSTTVKPNRIRVYEVYSEPYRPSTSSSTETVAESSTTATEKPHVNLDTSATERKENFSSEHNNNSSTNNNNSSGFVPPQPMNFHDNTYTFNSQTSSEYVSKDGWRPVLYDRERQRDANQGTDKYYPSSTMATVHVDDNGNNQGDYEDEEELSNEHWYLESQGVVGSGGPDNNKNDAKSKPKLKIKPSMPLPPMTSHHHHQVMNNNHQHHNNNNNDNPHNMLPTSVSRVKFPENDIQQQQQQQQQQQSILHHTQQNSNNIIDRSKYFSNRPAPPPILMKNVMNRRTPHFNFPFNPHNRKRNTKPPLPHQIVPPHHRRGPQFQPPNNSPFSPSLDNNNNNNDSHNNNNNYKSLRSRFKNHNNKPQRPPTTGNGNVHWPGEDNFTRRNGGMHPQQQQGNRRRTVY